MRQVKKQTGKQTDDSHVGQEDVQAGKPTDGSYMQHRSIIDRQPYRWIAGVVGKQTDSDKQKELTFHRQS